MEAARIAGSVGMGDIVLRIRIAVTVYIARAFVIYFSSGNGVQLPTMYVHGVQNKARPWRR